MQLALIHQAIISSCQLDMMHQIGGVLMEHTYVALPLSIKKATRDQKYGTLLTRN